MNVPDVAPVFAIGGTAGGLIFALLFLGRALLTDDWYSSVRESWPDGPGLESTRFALAVYYLCFALVDILSSAALWSNEAGDISFPANTELTEAALTTVTILSLVSIFAPLLAYSLLRGHHHALLGGVRHLMHRLTPSEKLVRRAEALEDYARTLEADMEDMDEADARRKTLDIMRWEALERAAIKRDEAGSLVLEDRMKLLRRLK